MSLGRYKKFPTKSGRKKHAQATGGARLPVAGVCDGRECAPGQKASSLLPTFLLDKQEKSRPAAGPGPGDFEVI
jgi:hypothetical protein